MTKGHYARAAEKFSRAAEEAQKTLLVPDCLVTYTLRYEQLNALLSHATAPTVDPADVDDALREACLRLLPSVMAVLERRKAAGTLLPGSCRPVEERFQMAVKRHDLEVEGISQAEAARAAPVLVPYFGVETFIRVAASVAFMLHNTGVFKRAFSLSGEQKQAAYLFMIVSALDLMTRPRDYNGWLVGEPDFVRRVRLLIPTMSDIEGPETKKLRAAWRRLLRSGVLRARGIEEGIDRMLQLETRTRAAADAEVAAGRLQQCALAGCAALEAHASHFKRCGACRTVCYCCREHQVEDWPSHKAACKAARKAAADPVGECDA